MPAGRPTKYTYEYCLKEILLFKERLFSDGGGENGLKYFTWHDLVRDRPYSRQRISEWREKYKDKPKLSDTLKKIDEELENRLFKFALVNKVNPTMAIFSLKNNFGWKDRQDITSGDKPIESNLNVIVDNSDTAETLKRLRENGGQTK
jgi:hypothetical protein